MEELLEIRDLRKGYRGKCRKGGEDRAVLSGLSLRLFRGEILGIRGRNGAGKSTLLQIIAAVRKPDSGELLYRGAEKRGISYLPQELSLYEELTVSENLHFYGAALSLRAEQIQPRCRWLLERLGLSGREKNLVSELSGGMKRRVHLASALMGTPELLLLDEPTVGSDDESAERILALIRPFRERGSAVILTSHRSGELDELCDRVMTLESGRLLEA